MGNGNVSRGSSPDLLLPGLLLLALSAPLAASEPVESFASLDPADVVQVSAQLVGPGGTGETFIRLGSTHFDPRVSIPAPRESVADIKSFEPGGKGYYIVQFDGPVMPDWKTALQDAGVELFDYIPEYAFIVRMDPGVLSSVERLAHVRWIGIYQPSYRISQATMDSVVTKAVVPGDPVPDIDLKVSVFPGEDSARIEGGIAALNGRVTKQTSTRWRNTLLVTMPSDRVADLAGIDGVKWVENAPRWRLHNNASTDVMAVRTPRDSFALYGEGQTVGICDTGLD